MKNKEKEKENERKRERRKKRIGKELKWIGYKQLLGKQ